MRFLIPSKGRSRTMTTPWLLMVLGVDPSDIMVVVDDSEMSDYKQSLPKSTMVVTDNTTRHPHCLATAVNQGILHTTCDELICVMDDDLKGFYVADWDRSAKMGGNRTGRLNDRGFNMLLHDMENVMNENDNVLLLSPRVNTNTSGYRHRGAADRYKANYVVPGSMWITRAFDVFMDEEYARCEDLELSLRIIRDGGLVVVDGAVAPVSTARSINPDAKGGRSGGYDADVNVSCYERLEREYGSICRLTKSNNGRRMTRLDRKLLGVRQINNPAENLNDFYAKTDMIPYGAKLGEMMDKIKGEQK